MGLPSVWSGGSEENEKAANVSALAGARVWSDGSEENEKHRYWRLRADGNDSAAYGSNAAAFVDGSGNEC